MLTGIGIIIILKQIPYFFGYNSALEGNFAFFHLDGENTFSEIINSLNFISPGATLIAVIAMFILLLWSNILTKKGKIFQLIQRPLIADASVIVCLLATYSNANWGILSELLVRVPVPEDAASFFGQFSFPNYGAITNPQVWITAFTIALVASLETLLCVEATDKIDPYKRVTPTNRELLDQGVGNILSGMIGGLSVTQVIV